MSRYIDAEILLDAMRHITIGETDVARSEMKIVHYICHMPHIDDVRENVRGEWIETDTTWMAMTEAATVQIPSKICSVCQKPVPQIMWNNFCPNCGADMRG